MKTPKHNFTTITGDDWKRSLAQARARGNPVVEKIKAIAAAKLRALK